MCYKILNNLVSVDADAFFTLHNRTSTRGHSTKLYKQRTTSVRDANFFSDRIVNIWNSLPMTLSPHALLLCSNVNCTLCVFHQFDYCVLWPLAYISINRFCIWCCFVSSLIVFRASVSAGFPALKSCLTLIIVSSNKFDLIWCLPKFNLNIPSVVYFMYVFCSIGSKIS